LLRFSVSQAHSTLPTAMHFAIESTPICTFRISRLDTSTSAVFLPQCHRDAALHRRNVLLTSFLEREALQCVGNLVGSARSKYGSKVTTTEHPAQVKR
jgi:hypothetical protein